MNSLYPGAASPTWTNFSCLISSFLFEFSHLNVTIGNPGWFTHEFIIFTTSISSRCYKKMLNQSQSLDFVCTFGYKYNVAYIISFQKINNSCLSWCVAAVFHTVTVTLLKSSSRRPKVFYEIAVLKYFEQFTWKARDEVIFLVKLQPPNSISNVSLSFYQELAYRISPDDCFSSSFPSQIKLKVLW